MLNNEPMALYLGHKPPTESDFMAHYLSGDKLPTPDELEQMKKEFMDSFKKGLSPAARKVLEDQESVDEAVEYAEKLAAQRLDPKREVQLKDVPFEWRAEIMAEAWVLRFIDGKSYREIGKELDISHETVRLWCNPDARARREQRITKPGAKERRAALMRNLRKRRKEEKGGEWPWR